MNLLKHSDAKKALLKDPEVKKEYDALKPDYMLISALINARVNRHITQKELSLKTGIHQSNISKIETGEYSPSLKTMKKIADALNTDLKIELVLRD